MSTLNNKENTSPTNAAMDEGRVVKPMTSSNANVAKVQEKKAGECE
jgi:hypothetical protein